MRLFDGAYNQPKQTNQQYEEFKLTHATSITMLTSPVTHSVKCLGEVNMAWWDNKSLLGSLATMRSLTHKECNSDSITL